MRGHHDHSYLDVGLTTFKFTPAFKKQVIAWIKEDRQIKAAGVKLGELYHQRKLLVNAFRKDDSKALARQIAAAVAELHKERRKRIDDFIKRLTAVDLKLRKWRVAVNSRRAGLRRHYQRQFVRTASEEWKRIYENKKAKDAKAKASAPPEPPQTPYDRD
jgi:hypothetical protein